jgi:hypothetical protein
MESNSEEILNFDLTKEDVYSHGDSFRYKLSLALDEISIQGEKMTSSIYKNHLGYMEQETCKVYIHDNRIVLDSETSSTSIAIGIVEK